MARILVWFRNDLRIRDNEIINRVAIDGNELLPVYFFDPRQFGKTSFGFDKTGPFRARFLYDSVLNLKKNLKQLGADLAVFQEKPETVIPELVEEFKIDEVFVHAEITSEEVEVENRVELAIHIPLRKFWGATLFHRDDIPFERKQIPDIFTQFRKKCEKNTEIRAEFDAPGSVKGIGHAFTEVPEIDAITSDYSYPSEKSVVSFNGGEDAALNRLNEYFWEKDLLKSYKKTRNGLLGGDYSSKFSPWLANGSISPRTIYWQVKEYEEQRIQNKSTYWLIFELIWRDYFRYSAMKYGNLIFKSGGIQGKKRDWNQDEEIFYRWANAVTGIPFIDANMRELNETGFMSNRGRQNVASFLAQNLNIDWRMGAEYFESMLLDYDPASNYGNWAYNATVGHDPRNRYFNILNQANRYDKKGNFVKYWLNELNSLPESLVHEPHVMNEEQIDQFGVEPGVDYPLPIIELEESYEQIRNRE